MCRLQCFLVFAAISISYVNSWDIAITNRDQLEFYNDNGDKINSEERQFRDLSALAYDAVHNMLLFVDKQSDNASIFSYKLATKKYQPLVRKKMFENIQGLTFDPISALLFWTDANEKSIYWKSLKQGSQDDVYGNLLFQLDDEIPRDIAVDSCRGYVYWTNTNSKNATIERARFNGSERQVVVNSGLFMPVSLAIDQRTRKLYWADDKEGIHFSIESSNLDGTDRRIVVKGTQHQPNTLTVSKDAIYWIDWGFHSVWKLAKNAAPNSEPQLVFEFAGERQFGIVANYQILDQVEGIPECNALKNLSENASAISDSFNIPKDAGIFCLNGIKIGTLCNCTKGYIGKRCETSVCHNYCLNGDCNFTEDGKPECRCKKSFTGARCEKDVCEGYCLNNGICSSNENSKPLCRCSGDYEGERCEVFKFVPKEAEATDTKSNVQPLDCNCTKDNTNAPSEKLVINDGDFVTTCTDGWDSVRDPVIMILGIFTGLLCITCAFLITRVLKLNKRPRIKKRIIVNKNVTPLTARPDQCEITIENCCNMNICETPCFEPRSTIRPTLLDSKPGKEEKKNLISNMEYPDDY